jgi:hypothetical protein
MLNKTFITAGKAIFTVANPAGKRYTYRIKHRGPQNGYGPAWFVSVLTGPDNTSSYTYMGMLDPATGEVRLTAKSKFGGDSLPVKVVRWALGVLWAEKPVPEGYKVCHEGKCGRCGRTLTVPESVESGIGPECKKHL